MAVLGVERNSGYTPSCQTTICEISELTLKAKGLLSQCCPCRRIGTILAGLSHINRESIDAIRTAVWELESRIYSCGGRGATKKGK